VKDRGQVYTLDIFFALALAALLVGYSGLALEQARKQTDEYMLRYSLEQAANDATDVLIKTIGRPNNWWENFPSLETVGLAQNDFSDNPIPNALSVTKFENLRQLCKNVNWNGYPNAAQAVMSLFDNSDKFEILLIDENKGENIWPPIYPMWDIKNASGAESSLNVTVVKRLISTNVKTENSIENLTHINTPPVYIMYFTIKPGELDTHDWYITLTRHLPPPPVQPEIRVWVNRSPNDSADWDFKSPPDISPLRMRCNGIDYPDGSDYVFPVPLHEGQNFIYIRIAGRNAPADVSIVSLPRNSPTRLVELPPVATLEVRLWR